MIVVEVLPSNVGTIVIAKSRDLGSIVYLQDGLCQSEADDKGVSYAPYIHAMFDLTIQAHAAKILLIGCGGGTLATMLTHAGLAVTVVDINPVSFDVAHRHFCLDETIPCHVDDGLSWLENSREKFDCIIVDAFRGEEMPDHLCSTLFFKEVKCHLSGDGVVLVNFLERTREFFLHTTTHAGHDRSWVRDPSSRRSTPRLPKCYRSWWCSRETSPSTDANASPRMGGCPGLQSAVNAIPRFSADSSAMIRAPADNRRLFRTSPA